MILFSNIFEMLLTDQKKIIIFFFSTKVEFHYKSVIRFLLALHICRVTPVKINLEKWRKGMSQNHM